MGSFVGRGPDLARLTAVLASAARLITVTGAPGIGKSRLALEVAAGEARLREGEVVSCDFAEARDEDGLLRTLAGAVGVHLSAAQGASGALEQVGLALAARGRALVVLDNVDRVAHLAGQIAALVSLAPQAQFLATSRERLRLRGEQVHELGPLSDTEATRLLLDRGLAARPGLEQSLAPEVAVQIARCLDGLPLALELAAARLSLLSPETLLARLARRFDVLGPGPRDAASHQSTLRAAIDWSWDLLTVAEQACLARASVFHGGMSLEAAEQVLGELPGAASVLDTLQALVDKSVLRAGRADGGLAGLRLGMLESIAAYGRDRLDASGQAGVVAARHSAHYAALGEALAAAVEQTGDPLALRHLAVERDNLVAAAASRAASPTDALRALLALEPLVQAHGRLPARLPLLDEALDPSRAAGVDPALRARGLVARADARRAGGDSEGSVADCLEAAALAERVAPAVRARALLSLGITRQHQGRLAEADALLASALEGFAQARDASAEGFTVGNLALLLQAQGRWTEADQAYGRAATLLARAGHRRYLALFRGFTGTLRCEQGQLAEARDCYQQAIAGLSDVGDRRFHGLFTAAAAAVEAAQDRITEAAEAFARAQAELESVADVARLGVLDVLEGHLDLARARAAEAAGDRGAALQHRSSAHARVAAAMRPGATGGPSLADRSDEVRIAVRLLQRAVGSGVEAATGSQEARVFKVALEGGWFQPATGARVDLARHGSLQRLLTRLADRRVHAPGRPLTSADLIAAGWPGERIIPRAASNRLYVALTTLRKLGLAGVLVHRDGGYLLDPAVPLEQVVDP